MAARRAPSRAACGVWAAATSSRSTAPTTRASRTRFSESATGTTGTAAPSIDAAASTTLRTSSVVSAGRAASWTRISASSSWPAEVSAQRPAMTESARTSPPGTTRHRSPAPGSAARIALDGIGRHRHGDVGEVRIGEEDVEAPAPGRPAPDIGPQLVAAHAPATAGGDEDGGVWRAHPRSIGPQSASRGCAKIIRPATVWRTRVTLTGTSRSMKRTPPSTTIIVPSSR